MLMSPTTLATGSEYFAITARPSGRPSWLGFTLNRRNGALKLGLVSRSKSPDPISEFLRGDDRGPGLERAQKRADRQLRNASLIVLTPALKLHDCLRIIRKADAGSDTQDFRHFDNA